MVQESRKEWRPPNWDKVNPDPCTGCKRKEVDGYGFVCDLACGEHSAYLQREAGADAMLLALIEEESLYQNTKGMQDGADSAVLSVLVPNKKGWVVLIPDEEE